MLFKGEYAFLSNFYPTRVHFEGVTYRSAEHAYQAQKTSDAFEKILIMAARSPAKAKWLGRKCAIKHDWEQFRYRYMLGIVTAKFYPGSELAELLLATGDIEIVEDNTWGDTYWGRCNGVGENNLGKILMQVRDQLRKSQGD